MYAKLIELNQCRGGSLNAMKSLSNLTYDERLIQLGNDCSELHRLRADLLMCYKILHRSVDLNHEDFFTMSIASLKREAVRINSLYQFL